MILLLLSTETKYTTVESVPSLIPYGFLYVIYKFR